MKASPLLIPSRQPAWLRLLLTVTAALISVACTERRYTFGTMVAWFVAYFVLTGLPWLIARRLPAEHPIHILQAEHEQLSKRFWSYRGRESFWIGFGLLVALFVAHGLPDSQHGGPYVFGAIYFLSGIAGMLYWHFKHHELQSTGIT